MRDCTWSATSEISAPRVAHNATGASQSADGAWHVVFFISNFGAWPGWRFGSGQPEKVCDVVVNTADPVAIFRPFISVLLAIVVTFENAFTLQTLLALAITIIVTFATFRRGGVTQLSTWVPVARFVFGTTGLRAIIFMQLVALLLLARVLFISSFVNTNFVPPCVIQNQCHHHQNYKNTCA